MVFNITNFQLDILISNKSIIFFKIVSFNTYKKKENLINFVVSYINFRKQTELL